MSKYSVGNTVVAVKDIHRMWSGKQVKAGSKGVVTASPMWGGQASVRFTTHSMWSGDQDVDLEVDDNEIRRA